MKLNRIFIYFILCIVVSLCNTNQSSATSSEHIYVIETQNTAMVFSENISKKFLFQYYGLKLNDLPLVMKSGIGAMEEAYPVFGIECIKEKALQVTHADGNMSLDLFLKSVDKIHVDDNITLTKISLYDDKYPFSINLYYKAYFHEDVIETWSEITNEEYAPVTLYKFASCYLPVNSMNPWLTHFHGQWGNEFGLTEEKLERGVKVIKNRNGIRVTQCDNPSFMLSPSGKPMEDKGDIIAGTLAWTGTYKIEFDMDQSGVVNVIAGINEDASQVILESNEAFQTPHFILTFSNRGKGQASRNLHHWALNYGIRDGNKERNILLNSWEGVYFDITEDKMLSMIDDIAALGGELFVMDDGWFGDKYPRNDETTSLGDWKINPAKLPNGLQPLIKRAKENHIKFGIWIEPEMVNKKSELFENHPEWIVHQPNRETVMGRGGSQMLLDLCNPEVQDYVYNAINDLLGNNPGIGYIKWDANHFMTNIASSSLPAINQSSFYIEYQKGLQKVFEKIAENHPNIILQACSSGGGRVTYGYLKYFHEFWTSDNTDALSRIYMQWGTSHIFPAINMASHVSASPNHQTGRVIPLKFRFDVAMTGRLGMEMQPGDLTPEEWQFSKKAIEIYKSIRPVIQFGDLYRLISPYENNDVASLMYVSQDKKEAILFAFNLDRSFNNNYPPFKLRGLDASKKYHITEINKEDNRNGIVAENQTFTGEFLINAGIRIQMNRVLQSVVIKLTEVE